eukprot:scaffold5215_cov181-Amphora_coffeaeformis.AAC.6
MKYIATLFAFAGSAAAFAPSSVQKLSESPPVQLLLKEMPCVSIATLDQVVCFKDSDTSRRKSSVALVTPTALNLDLESMAGSTAPFKKFDPLGYSQLGTDETLNWFRAAELKNGRVAMLATTGYLVQAAGIHFPGMLSSDISFESLSVLNPLDQWGAVPDAGKWQIILTIFVAELATETKKPHYFYGGPTPEIVFPPIDFSSVKPETMKVKKDRELNNGRLAMIAIISFISEKFIPGSVPAISGLDAFH